ncbi:hypothetical protein B0T14DRAFT_571174 [Immersiella caudata]|uniref:Uncharacterized protein n=1 Tax=Immersiella caudata TaxID=314043 RepID=A0AA39U553_9PEZI|nr:hypothetical protein B0T14DRAFT_571174 [Immersiella caudata]
MAGIDRPTKTGGAPPFTTDFTPPDGFCAFTYLNSGAPSSPYPTSLWLGYSLGDAKYCYPTSFYENAGTFSPAQCPQSFTTAKTYALTGGSSGAVCCSSGYTYDGARSLAKNDKYDWCTRVVPTNTIGIFADEPRPIYGFTFTSDPPVTALVRAVHVRWEQSDLPGLGLPPETSASSGSNGLAHETEAPIIGGGGGLSDTAKAGIGAGVGVLAVTIIAAILLLLRRRRRGSSLREKGGLGEDASLDGPAGAGSGVRGNGALAAGVAMAAVPAAAAAAASGARGQATATGGQDRPQTEEIQGPWSEYMARWAANQEDWAVYQAGAQQDGLTGDGDPQDDAHAGALPVDGRTPQDVVGLEDTMFAKPPGFAESDLEDFKALEDEKPRVSEDSTLVPSLPRDEKNERDVSD